MVCTVGMIVPSAGFSRLNLRVSQVQTTRVHFGEPVSARLKEENGGGLTSSSFGRLRCCKSPARVFWTSWIHWHYYQGHFQTFSTSVSPLKSQQASGSLKPSLLEDMFW
jgi:hypothetical protein